jgi:hypothetical protein
LSELAAVTRQALDRRHAHQLVAAQTKRNPLVSDADLDGPEWIDPAAGHHRDLTALTAAVRGELDRAVRRVNATLGMAGRHSYNA